MTAPFVPRTDAERAAVVALVGTAYNKGFEAGESRNDNAIVVGSFYAERVVPPVPTKRRLVECGQSFPALWLSYNTALQRFETDCGELAMRTYSCAVDAVCDCWPPSVDRDAKVVELIELRNHPDEPAPDRLTDALAVPEVWSREETDGMIAAFDKAQKRHGMIESLIAVAAWLLRHRAALAESGRAL